MHPIPRLVVRLGLTAAIALVALTLAAASGPRIETEASTLPTTVTIPPAGGVTVTVAGASSLATLVRALPFEVESVAAFDITAQRFLVHVPGAPPHASTLTDDQLQPGTIVWLKRRATDKRAVEPPAEPAASTVLPQTLPAPRPGELTVGAAGTDSLETLVAAQPFGVTAAYVLDVPSQRFLMYIAGAPGHVNTLAKAKLRPDSIVWLRRSSTDAVVAGNESVAHPPLAAAPLTPAGSPAPASDPVVPAAFVPGDAPAPEAPSAPPAQAPVTEPTATPTPEPASAALPPPRGDLIRYRSYEAGDSIVEGAHTSTSHGLGTTTEAARAGSAAGFALLKPGDPMWKGNIGYRAEWHGDDHVSAGTERWHGISYYFPKDYNQGKNSTWNDRIIFQFADEGSPMFSLHIDAAKQELWVRRKAPDGSFHRLGSWPFQTERWYDIVFHVVWTKSGDGVFEVYVDGERKVRYQGRTLAVRSTTYSKWGIYGQPTRLFFDEVRIAEGKDRLNAVSP